MRCSAVPLKRSGPGICFSLLFLILSVPLFAQSRNITGTVTDSQKGETLPAVNIFIKGTTTGTMSRTDGKYSIDVPEEATSLVFSYVGMITREVDIGDRAVIDVAMEPDIYNIEELMVVGYGTQKKREVTGSISSVKGEEISKLVTPSFEIQLAGRIPGVQVTWQDGVIGSIPRFRIRGENSITSGTYPLVVVDGVPAFTERTIGVAWSNPLADINPADIESIEILKDGSATAIYGSRAANGVVLITTKKSSAGKARLTYNNYLAMATPVKLWDLLNTDEFIEISNEKRANSGLDPVAQGRDFDTDWQRAVMREHAFQQDHNLGISGSTDQTGYYFSVGYTHQQGVALPNEMRRYTARANIDQILRKWLTLGFNLGITRTEYQDLNTGANSLSSSILNSRMQLPNTPVYDPDDPTGYNIDDINSYMVGRWDNQIPIDNGFPNIRYVVDHNKLHSNIWRILGSTYLSFDILPSLNFRTHLRIDNASIEELAYFNPVHGGIGQGSNGVIYNDFGADMRWNWQYLLTFNRDLGMVHNLTAVLVYEYQFTRSKQFYGSGSDLSNEFFQHNLITGAHTIHESGGRLDEHEFNSIAARLNYNLLDRYFLQASLRYDGISSLPEENRRGFFPGASVGWNVAREPFLEDASRVLSDLKLRASYAVVGNTNIGYYPYAGLYSNAPYADYNGIAFSQVGNPELKWETSSKMNIGLDALILSGKYQFTFDYYRNNIDGLILAVPTPPSLGIPDVDPWDGITNPINENIGAMRNWGYEFSLQASLIRSAEFSWSVGANLTLARNEVTQLLDSSSDILGPIGPIRIGESLNSIFTFDYLGVNAANGNPIYRKQDASGTMVQENILAYSFSVYDPGNPADESVQSTLIYPEDGFFIGPSLPTYFGSIFTQLGYKGFDLNVMLNYSGGNYLVNVSRVDLMGPGFMNNSKEILGRWKSPAEPGDGWTPKINDTQYGESAYSSRFVEKGDYIKVQNITLGYTFPASLTGKAGIQQFRLYVQAQEAFLFTNYTGIDPEMEATGLDWNGVPRQRVLSIGMNLTF